jgi:hypothetical protein
MHCRVVFRNVPFEINIAVLFLINILRCDDVYGMYSPLIVRSNRHDYLARMLQSLLTLTEQHKARVLFV